MTGGLVTTCTVVKADFWRLGQCRPGDTVHFKRISWDSALLLRRRTEEYLASVKANRTVTLVDISLPDDWEDTILARIPETETTDEVVFRQSGDCYIHVTYGAMVSSALTRVLVQYRVKRIQEMSDIIEVTGAVRCKCDVSSSLTSSVSRPIRPARHDSQVSTRPLDGAGTFPGRLVRADTRSTLQVPDLV
jgi:urea carboxylase